MRLYQKLVIWGLCILVPYQAHAFQVTCASQGYWTAQAINEMTRLQGVLNELKNDPNCQGIESVVQDMESARKIMQEHDLPYGNNSARFMSLPGEIASLYTYIQGGVTGGLMDSARNLLVNKILGMAAAQNNVGVQPPTGEQGQANPVDDAQLSWQNMQDRVRRTSMSGMTMMQKVFDVLPNYEQCVSNRPDQSLALVSAAITMFAAFSSGEAGSTNEMAKTLASFVTYMRNIKFGTVLGKLKQMEYWSNLSCLIESTSNTYCSVKDSYALLDYQNPGYRHQTTPTNPGPTGIEALSPEEMRKLSSPDHPLHGYYIMVREIPTISRWLQEVQFGIEPKMKQDADFKNATLTTMTNFLAAINNIKAIFNEKMVIYQRTPDVAARRNQLFQLLKEIVDNQLLGRMGEENFFTMAVPERKLPFYLVGYEAVPEEVLPNQYRTMSANWADWMENGGQYRKEWDDPDALLSIIRSRLWLLMDNASELGSNWFRLRFNVDPINLISRSVTDPNITAVESLVSIYGYLGRLAERLSKDTNKNYVVLPDIIDSIDRIQKVLGQFQEMRKLTQTYFPGVTNSKELGLRIAKMKPEDKKKISEVAGEILTTAYIQFNIILQRDTFLANRLNTLVMYDYSDRVRKGEGMTEYVRDLMVVTGRALLDRLVQAQGTNPNQMMTDLDNASTLLATSLEAMEEIFSEDLDRYLYQLLNKAGGLTFISGGFMSPGQFVRVAGDDTPNKAFAQVKARVCLQTLQFKNFDQFRNLCYESVLRSQFDETPRPPEERIKYGVEAIYSMMVGFRPAVNKLVDQAHKMDEAEKGEPVPMDSMGQKLKTLGRALFDENVYKQAYKKPEPYYLSVAYDDLLKERRKTKRKTGYDQICVVRDFLRKNEVFWLTKQFEDQQMDRFVQIQELEKHWAQVEAEERRKMMEEDLENKAKDGDTPATKGAKGANVPGESPIGEDDMGVEPRDGFDDQTGNGSGTPEDRTPGNQGPVKVAPGKTPEKAPEPPADENKPTPRRPINDVT